MMKKAENINTSIRVIKMNSQSYLFKLDTCHIEVVTGLSDPHGPLHLHGDVCHVVTGGEARASIEDEKQQLSDILAC